MRFRVATIALHQTKKLNAAAVHARGGL